MPVTTSCNAYLIELEAADVYVKQDMRNKLRLELHLFGTCQLFSYPVDDDLLRGHRGKIALFGEQVRQAHFLQVLNQVIVLLQLKPRENHLTSPARDKNKKRGLIYFQNTTEE